ncbi:MAG TPA: DUF255 domain-containing protein [Vicinamibacterales bacterium]|jgi:hypothetical protein
MIEWEAWSADAFARATRERKPILLAITAAWCGACHEMDRTTYAHPDVAALIAGGFVPVRVDTDRRPDINERYNLGGWPTTAFLTPGGDVLAGGTFVPVDRMPGVLRRVLDACDRDAALVAGDGPADRDRAQASGAACGRAPLDGQDLLDAAFSTYDEAHGGFGIEPKFPHTAPIHLAIDLWRETGAPRWRAIVERTLDAMADGGLRDGGGGYFRYAATRDWQRPHREQLLDTNAAVLRACAESTIAFGRGADRDRCASIVAFLRGTLGADGGGFYGSADDRALYAESNALATRALLAASLALDDPAIGTDALASFERVLLACYRPGEGVAHYFDGRASVRGLAADQIGSAAALLDAYELGAGEPYAMLAEELARHAVADMWDGHGGGLFDRAPAPDDVGLLRQRRKPFVLNAETASLLARLGQLRGLPDLNVRAPAALAAAAVQLDGQGPLAAHYVLALRMVDSADRENG